MGNPNDICAAVVDDLTFDPDVDASDITVEDRGGEMVLAGSVPSYPQYIEAGAVASRVAGVKDVHNYLEVALPPGDHRDDSALTATANDALTLAFLSMRRLAAWETAWSSVGPQWSKGRP
ncbi:MAG TPA: BON domain-containing protein [Streptosporangiaceae bacterium]